jgi:hypothetical protein
MTVFISHSFENKQAGASLREQLRSAVDRCSSYLFIASRKSIDSSWCGAELSGGAVATRKVWSDSGKAT